ncbi:ABC transporter permease [Flectobacillus roseus]|uniref:ABC transporter permease n=1 Tax=Flectobacillus roseus TaxID=502259 RepID=UPI0024B6DB7C|nr:FtsX-like permease family protein [Flectobacillus roseus]MDI9872500.1 FtsX-like permease family protein [Flectobacillus roseus]
MTNFPRYISNRIQNTASQSFSATVTKIGIGSIALGLMVMIIAFGILFGFKDAIRQKLFSITPHIRVAKFSANESYEEYPITKQTDLYRHYKNIPDIKHLQVSAQKAGILKTPEEMLGVVMKGISRDFDTTNFHSVMIAGKPIQFNDTTYSKDILISKIIADKLKLNVGDNAIIYFLNAPDRPRKLNVSGIYETGLEEFDKTLIIGDLGLIQKINGWGADSVGAYEIYLKDFDAIQASSKVVQDKMQPDMKLEKVTDKFMGLFDWLGMLDRNMVIFLTLILFVACFNMISILLVLMMERTPMIGLFKALGSSNWQIRKIFLWSGFLMIFKGMVYGNIIGIGFCLIQQHFKLIPLDPANYYMNTVPITMNWGVIILLNLATVSLVLFVLLIPTFVITRIQPIKAIIFKK